MQNNQERSFPAVVFLSSEAGNQNPTPLMVLAWRIVGNEFRSSMAGRASEAISRLCDFDEWENAVMAFASTDAAPDTDRR